MPSPQLEQDALRLQTEQTFRVYQIPERHREEARDAFFYKKEGDIYNQENVRTNFQENKYVLVAQVNAYNLDHVFELLNLWNDEDRVTTFGRCHSLSVGDLVLDDHGSVFVVASVGFDPITVPQRRI